MKKNYAMQMLKGSLKLSITVISALIFLLGMTNMVNSQTIRYVKHDATGNNNGTSWTNAYTILQSALTAASSGQQIWVSAGTYQPSAELGGIGSRYQTFKLKKGVASMADLRELKHN